MNDKYKFLPKTFQELESLSNKKLIYNVKNDPKLFVKIIELNNIDKYISVLNEIKLQQKANEYNLSPKILDYYIKDNVIFIIMEKIDGKTIYDIYGDSLDDIPKYIFIEIHNKLNQLLCIGIEYIDISPYNFMIENNTKNLKIIDFGHAKSIELNWFVKDYLTGNYSWNPDF
jgi:serine/threonine protein kinase